MRIVFIGAVDFSRSTLVHLLSGGAQIVGVCSQAGMKNNSDYATLHDICIDHAIPLLLENDLSSATALKWIRDLRPDVIFCFGWSRILGEDVLRLAPLGVIGFHPAALPQNRGRHPIVWALALGLQETASTFFFMDTGADSGDILSQKPVDITGNDDAGSLYAKVTKVALSQIDEFVPALASNNFTRTKQDHSRANTWRKRQHVDGIIDWRMSADVIVNLVRALSKPYIGASFLLDGEELKLWEAQAVLGAPENVEPGKVLVGGGAGETLVKCGIGAVRLLRIEPEVRLREGSYL